MISGASDPVTDPRLGANLVGAQRDELRPWPSFVSLRPYEDHRVGDNYQHNPPRIDTGSVSAIIRAFKSSSTLLFHRLREGGPYPLWQRNYYEHIIRRAVELDQIRTYILTNPDQWELDQENPSLKI